MPFIVDKPTPPAAQEFLCSFPPARECLQSPPSRGATIRPWAVHCLQHKAGVYFTVSAQMDQALRQT